MTARDGTRKDWASFIRGQFTPLMLAGLGCIALGAVSAWSPARLVGSLRWILGAQFIGLGLLTVGPWIFGRVKGGRRVHGGLPVGTQAGIALVFGVAFLSPRTISMGVLASLIWVGLMVDGGIQLFFGFRRPLSWQKSSLVLSGLVTLGVAVWSAVADRAQFWSWIGPLVGFKLLIFGASLVWMAVAASREDGPSVYGSLPFRFTKSRVPGEAYAVYIGNAFHVGLYVGNDEVVDFRNDDRIHLTTWDRFVLGRRPVHWEYPDLPAVAPEEVVRFARACVGEARTYEFLTFNCEHFVIWCKTLGASTHSRFGQMGLAESLFQKYPLLGSALEIHTRFLGWIAYLLGGRSGRRLSLLTRYTGALMSTWLLSLRHRIRAKRTT